MSLEFERERDDGELDVSSGRFACLRTSGALSVTCHTHVTVLLFWVAGRNTVTVMYSFSLRFERLKFVHVHQDLLSWRNRGGHAVHIAKSKIR